jgi:hypothetical protein
MTTVYLHICNSFVLGDLAKHLQIATISMSYPPICPFMLLVSNLFMGKDHTLFLWAGLQAVGEKITLSGICNYCEIFIMYTRITNVAADYVIQPGGLHAACGPQVGDPWSMWNMVTVTRYFN